METESMPAAIFAAEGRLEIVERPVPRVVSATDVLVRVEACGVCGSDLKILEVPPGHPARAGVILGHEFVGTVREAGLAATSLKVGDRVVVRPDLACGHCVYCKRGQAVHCSNWTAIGVHTDGGLAPYVKVPAEACYLIANNVPSHVAALTEPLATVIHGARKAKVFPGETAIVIGGGPIGLMFSALLNRAGATVLVIEPTTERAAVALKVGASGVYSPGSGELENALAKSTVGLGADVVVDTVGSQLQAALPLVRKGGRIVAFGVNSFAKAEIAQFDVTSREVEIIGAFVGQDVFPPAIRLLEQASINFEPLVTHRIGLEALPEALRELHTGRAIKVQVHFPDSA